MLTRYAPLFAIQIRHLYYKEAVCNDLAVVPSPECQGLMQQYGLLFKSQTAGAMVACKEEANEAERPTLIKNLDSPLVLTFFLQSKNPFFFNFTNLPFPDADSHYAFDNLEATKTEKEVLLSKNTFVSSEDLVSEAPPLNNCLGTIDIHLAPQNQAAAAFLQDGKILAQNYLLSFTNRSSIWRYYLIANQDAEFSDFEISDPKMDVVFSASSEKVILSNTQEATLMTADKPIALEEQRSGFFKLKANKKLKGEDGFSTAITINLPNADPRQIKPLKEADQLIIYSDSYIYL